MIFALHVLLEIGYFFSSFITLRSLRESCFSQWMYFVCTQFLFSLYLRGWLVSFLSSHSRQSLTTIDSLLRNDKRNMEYISSRGESRRRNIRSCISSNRDRYGKSHRSQENQIRSRRWRSTQYRNQRNQSTKRVGSSKLCQVSHFIPEWFKEQQCLATSKRAKSRVAQSVITLRNTQTWRNSLQWSSPYMVLIVIS